MRTTRKRKIEPAPAQVPSTRPSRKRRTDPPEPSPHPNLIMHPMPYHECFKVIIPPTDLVRKASAGSGSTEMNHKFKMIQEDLRRISKPGTDTVFLRFCARDGSETDELHENERIDLFPLGLQVLVNGVDLALNQDRITHDRKKYSKPLDITKYIAGMKNELKIMWQDDPNLPNFLISAYLCSRPLSAQELRDKIISSNAVISTEITISQINKLLTNDDGISAPTTIQLSLACPILKNRIQYPCKGRQCDHPACFDLLTYLKTYEKRFCLRCPICKIRLKTSDICLDVYFDKLLRSQTHLQNVEVSKDGKIAWGIAGSDGAAEDGDFVVS